MEYIKGLRAPPRPLGTPRRRPFLRASRASRLNALTSTQASDDRYNRNWLARTGSVLSRTANRLNCSWIRYSISPRSQYSLMYTTRAGQASPFSDVTTYLGFSLPSICSALATTRRGRLHHPVVV